MSTDNSEAIGWPSSRADWVEGYIGNKLTVFQRRCVDLCCIAMGCGPYDFVPTWRSADWALGNGVRLVIRPDRLSTWDFPSLTDLVIAAHEWSIRVLIQPVNMQRIALIMHQREREHSQIWGRHPSIEEAITRVRRGLGDVHG